MSFEFLVKSYPILSSFVTFRNKNILRLKVERYNHVFVIYLYMPNKEFNQNVKQWEVWQEITDNGVTISFGRSEHILRFKSTGDISDKAECIHKFEAVTYEEAASIYNLRMGYGPYKPHGEPVLCPNHCGSYYYPESSGECPYCGVLD